MARNLLKSTAIVSAMTMISRVLGFVRDVIFARYFGASLAMDAFFVAFKIPNFLRRLFAEGAFSQAFVPVLSEYKNERSAAEVRELADRVSGTLGLILLAVTAVGVVGAPVLILIFAPGFVGNAGQYDLAANLLRVTFPYLFFISLTALAGGILNTYGRFGVPAFTPVLLNICFIAAAVFVAPHLAEPVYALALAVFGAGMAQLLFQLPFLWRLKMLPRPRWGWRHPGVKRILGLMLPTLFGASVAQINLLFDTLIASFLVTGSVSWLYYADRLMEFPLGVFGIALATVILPSLSQRHANADPKNFSATLDWALRQVFLIGLPAALGLGLLAGPMLTTLFHSEVFDQHDVAMSAASLSAYGAGLLGFILVKVLVPGFYARQDTRTPVRIGIIAMVTNMVLNVLFVVPMVWVGYAAPHVGLALATSASAFLNAALLYRALRRESVYTPQPGWWRFALKTSIAGLVMAAGLLLLVPPMTAWFGWSGWHRAGQLILWIFGSAAVYFLVLVSFGFRPRDLRSPATR
ncbi:MAG: murein biosynthesis integral membrane protein MurJ [Pseudomonadota bacterium]|nr:murein biosynthesis integral membrane protein MurJ [Pseudomonadota bacterium]